MQEFLTSNFEVFRGEKERGVYISRDMNPGLCGTRQGAVLAQERWCRRHCRGSNPGHPRVRQEYLPLHYNGTATKNSGNNVGSRGSANVIVNSYIWQEGKLNFPILFLAPGSLARN